jgi:hypothetical protein
MNCKYKNHHYIVLWEIKIFWPHLITRFLSLHLESRATPGISASIYTTTTTTTTTTNNNNNNNNNNNTNNKVHSSVQNINIVASAMETLRVVRLHSIVTQA